MQELNNKRVKVHNYGEMTEEIKNYIQDLRDEGIRVKIDDDQVKDLIDKIFENKSAEDAEDKGVEDAEDKGVEDASFRDFLNEYCSEKLISAYKGKNVNLPPIDARKVYEALNKLVNKEITQNKFFEIFNVFNNAVDELIRMRGKNVGTGQRELTKFRDKLKKVIESNPDIIDMLSLESEEEAAKNRQKQGKGLKILTPQQMLARLPISLVQLQAGNNSQKLKNDIRQLLYSLYR